MILLRMSAIPRLGYLTRVLPPRLTASHAATFDSLVLNNVIRKLGLPAALSDEAKQTLSLPIRLGGFGLRSVASTCHVAFWSSIALVAIDLMDIIPVDKRQQLLIDSKTQVHFARQLADCHHDLLAQGIPCGGDKGLMPLTITDFWNEFGAERPHGLQRVLSHKIITNTLNEYLRDPLLGVGQVQRVLSVSSRSAGAWLTCYPSSPELQLTDEDYCCASRLRLGLPCQEQLPEYCACNAKLEDDYAHFLSCSKLKGTAMTTRHDWLVNLLAKFFRNAGAVVHVEPRIFGTVRKRPDLDILLPNRQLLVDVTVVHPAAPSRKSKIRLSAVAAAETKKHRDYSSLARLHGASLSAFAVETYGGFGKQAGELLTLLQQTLRYSSSGGSSNRGIAEALAVALQQGNALVMRTGALAARRVEGDFGDV
jgi:hypothetical protein